jgi:hypothetical protein
MKLLINYKMNMKIKKIITREGLILLGVIIAYLFIGNRLCRVGPGGGRCIAVSDVVLCLYIAYLLIRFILWAIRTLWKR